MNVVFVFSHPTLFPVWDKAVALLRRSGVNTVVISQMATIDWDAFSTKTVANADALYLSLSGHFPNFATLIQAAQKVPLVAVSGVETVGAVSIQGSFDGDLSVGNTVDKYLKSGSETDLVHAVEYLLHLAGKHIEAPPLPDAPVMCGIWDTVMNRLVSDVAASIASKERQIAQEITDAKSKLPIVALCFGRSLWVEGDTSLPLRAAKALEKQGLLPLVIFCDWDLATEFGKDCQHPLHQILVHCKDRLASIWNGLFSHTTGHHTQVSPFENFDVPVFQVVRHYSDTAQKWAQSTDGLSPMSICYSLTQPEMLGCIEPTVLACNQQRESTLVMGTANVADVVEERVVRLASRTQRWQRLFQKKSSEKRVAIMLHNSPCKGVEGMLATAAGLDAADSTVYLLNRLLQDGYQVRDIPQNGEELLLQFLERKAICEFRWTGVDEIVRKKGALSFVNARRYNDDFMTLNPTVRKAVNDAWGNFPGESMVHPNEEGEPSLVISGLEFGNVIVMIEPKRGCYGPKCDGEVCRILHQPDIPPPHHFLATYFYLQRRVDAIVSMGADSPVEYLPGKRAGLSGDCFPEIVLGDIPVIYPYIVTATGEGLIAKRRGRAVIIDHLSPPKKSVSELSGHLDEIDELHRQVLAAQAVGDNGRVQKVKEQLRLICLHANLIDPKQDGQDFESFLSILPGRVMRLRNRKVENGVHVLGKKMTAENEALYVAEVAQSGTADWNETQFKAALSQTDDELKHVLSALNGRFVAPAQSGHLSRGKVEIVPTGRNFYGLDLKTVPTRAAHSVGAQMGEQLLQKYLTDKGCFPESIGITLWSSDVFRAEGELISQILWLLGCVPQWGAGDKVMGVHESSLSKLVMTTADGDIIERPRIDVLVQMSGVVRDTLPVFYQMLDKAVATVMELDEPESRNFVRSHYLKQLNELQHTLDGQALPALRKLAAKRVFSSKPGSYGVGVNLAIDAAAWNNDSDLAEAFINWTGYAYGAGAEESNTALESASLSHYAGMLKSLDVAYQKASAAEYDALSCGCYSGFQGGMAVAKRGLGGGDTKMYWGDSVSSDAPEVRDLCEEIQVGFAARLLNPDWVEMQKRLGYKGASSVASMVNAAHAWSATTHVVTKSQFDGICRVYVENEQNRKWLCDDNIYAFEEITRRLLEAHSRGLWRADAEQIDAVLAAALSIEGDLEERIGETNGEFQGGSVDIITSDEVDAWQFKYRIGKD